MNQPLPPANWYPDPGSTQSLRYWNGTAWTDFTQPIAIAPVPAAPAGAYGPPTGISAAPWAVSQPPHRWRAILALIAAAAVIAAVVLVGIVVRRQALSVPGAPGYVRAGGQHGRPIDSGQPWGSPCEPLRVAVATEVPDADYRQVATVIQEARSGGLNITLESRDFQWNPASVYHPSGTATFVQEVDIYSDDLTPPLNPDGQVQRVEFGWDSALQPGGTTERFTYAKAHLRLAALVGDPLAERTAIREFVALTQGIYGTTAPVTGIR